MILGPVSKNFQQQQQQVSHPPQEQPLFKVPSVSSQDSSSGKRKWQDAFTIGDNSHDTMLSLSCGAKQEQPRPKCSKLTIFYAGAVHVFDDVPEEMARALMTLAASKNLGAPTSLVQQAMNGSHSKNIQNNPNLFLQNLSNNNNNKRPAQNNNSSSPATGNFTFPVVMDRKDVVNNKVTSNIILKDESKLASSSRPASPIARSDLAAKTSSPKMQMLQGLPQARRASIQRFLEKRKIKQMNNDDVEDMAMSTHCSAPHPPSNLPHFLRNL